VRSRSGRELLHGNHDQRDKGARGGAQGRCPRRWSGHRRVAEHLSHTRKASDQESFKQRQRLTSGSQPFSKTQILIFELVTFLLSKFHQILQVDNMENKEQFYCLEQLRNPKGLQVINSGINSNLNFP
jgi:hypothetical protein